MSYVNEMIVMKKYNDACLLLEKIKKYQQKECDGLLPADNKFKAEKIYKSPKCSATSRGSTLGDVLFALRKLLLRLNANKSKMTVKLLCSKGLFSSWRNRLCGLKKKKTVESSNKVYPA